MEPPLIITVKIDEHSQEYFNTQRKLYFPKHLNFMDAHITLFHKLPSNEIIIDKTLERLSYRKSFSIDITEIKNIGTGVAYMVDAPCLMQIHKEMQDAFTTMLIGKDKMKLCPHITVQNNVTAHKADVLQKFLCETFIPFSVTAVGFSSWFYLQGPWEKKSDHLFQKS